MSTRASESGVSGARVSGISAAAFRDERSVADAELVVGAAVLALVAALAHLWAAPVHLVELWGYETFLWWLYAALHLLIFAVQGLYGVALLRWPGQVMFLAGIALNLPVVALYVVSHTAGIPSFLVPYDGRVESAGLLDAAGAGAEVALILILVASLRASYRERAISVLLFLVLALWLSRLVGVLS